MRKVFLLLIIFLISFGCRRIGEGEIDDKPNRGTQVVHMSGGFGARIKIVIVDNCEYIIAVYEGISIVHKANCSNPEHGRK